MFNKDFFPTPVSVIETMLSGIEIRGKVFLEPEAGKGDIVDYLNEKGPRKVLTCELNQDLATIVATKSAFLKNDFLDVDKSEVSAIDAIVMNPPFSADEKHILHAWEIAPPGCIISALCNYETINNPYSKDRKILVQIIHDYGFSQNLGDAFSTAQRKTGINVGLIRIQKPGNNSGNEFDGYFETEYVEEEQADGLIRYNEVRDCVNRYVAAVKLYDSVLLNAVQMDLLIGKFFNPYTSKLVFTITDNGKEKSREMFKLELQKAAWKYIFGKMNMRKYATTGVMADINKFVEEQQQIPFTVNNVYRMLEIIVGTTGSRMDKAMMEVFDSITMRYDENRYNLEGWKTNSHYLVNRKFILPYLVELSYDGYVNYRYREDGKIDDLVKALCSLTATNYDEIGGFYNAFRQVNEVVENGNIVRNKKGEIVQKSIRVKFGQKHKWGFFEMVAYKKGTVHFYFLDEKVWAMFNQRIAKIKGYPLPEKTNAPPKTYNPTSSASGSGRKPKPKPAPEQDAGSVSETAAEVEISRNAAKNGIEVKFLTFPSYEQSLFVKRLGFRWSSFSKVWYNTYSEQLMQKLSDHFGKEPTTKPAIPADNSLEIVYLTPKDFDAIVSMGNYANSDIKIGIYKGVMVKAHKATTISFEKVTTEADAKWYTIPVGAYKATAKSGYFPTHLVAGVENGRYSETAELSKLTGYTSSSANLGTGGVGIKNLDETVKILRANNFEVELPKQTNAALALKIAVAKAKIKIALALN